MPSGAYGVAVGAIRVAVGAYRMGVGGVARYRVRLANKAAYTAEYAERAQVLWIWRWL